MQCPSDALIPDLCRLLKSYGVMYTFDSNISHTNDTYCKYVVTLMYWYWYWSSRMNFSCRLFLIVLDVQIFHWQS